MDTVVVSFNIELNEREAKAIAFAHGKGYNYLPTKEELQEWFLETLRTDIRDEEIWYSTETARRTEQEHLSGM